MALFLATPGTRTLPVVIWPQIRYLLTPVVAAASSVIIAADRGRAHGGGASHQRPPADGAARGPAAREGGCPARRRTAGPREQRPSDLGALTPISPESPVRPSTTPPWSALLAAIVTPDGKVDYQALGPSGATCSTSVGGGTSARRARTPTPSASPTDDDGLAYWLNAYNAFTLHAIMDEYPIRSVWKTRDGQFFQRRAPRRRRARREPRRHRARDPARPLRASRASTSPSTAARTAARRCGPRAYEGDGIRDTLRAATEQFLASEWNCRVDHATPAHLRLAHLQDVRGGLRRRRRTRRRSTAAACCASSPSTPGVALEAIADYEVVYNVYDWGLNDAAREPHLGPILFHEPVEHFHEGDAELRELHLYEGNFCNRTCAWCTIDGSPEGWYRDVRAERVLDQALRTRGRRRQHQVLRRRADAARRGDHRRHAPPARRAASAACSRSSRTA